MVLIPKSDPMQIRMNVDMMTPLTHAIRRTRHAGRSTIQTEQCQALHQTGHETRVHAVPARPSFATDHNLLNHRGLRRSKCLTFGINSAAAEVFHKEMQTLTDIPNVTNIYDNILVLSAREEKHSIALCH